MVVMFLPITRVVAMVAVVRTVEMVVMVLLVVVLVLMLTVITVTVIILVLCLLGRRNVQVQARDDIISWKAHQLRSSSLYSFIRRKYLYKKSDAPYKLQTHPTQPRGGHPSHSNLVRGKLTSPTPNPAGDGTSGLTSYPRRRSKVSEATCLRPQRSAPSRTRTRPTQSPAL